MGPQKGNTNDLATLGDLDDQGLLEELRTRFSRNVIYTYIGDILISINPYTVIPSLYGDEIGRSYGKAKMLNDLKPHVYAIGSRAYQNVQRNQGNQCLLVSGESGSGKTEITKMLIAQIVRMSRCEQEYFLQDKIVEVNPLLEAFGNATTVMNDNSSRFGKLIELIFTESGEIIGATITEHMLEKSRIVRQSPGEKNFHVFYNMMCGFTEDERKRYFLEAPERYRIIDPGHGDPVIASEIDFTGYSKAMDNLRRIMPIVGFTNQDLDVVFALLAAILHLCNIEMAVEPESDEVMVMNEDEIDFAAVLLSVKAEDLISVLLANVNWVRGERIVYIKSLSQAVTGRDSLAMSIYTKLFSWIVQQVNFMLHEDEQREGERLIISILDMAGFENFQHNSLEQLCINAANERLQHYFNEHIFVLELQEFQQEGIKPPKLKFTNNTELLNLLFQRPMGLFSLIEEECMLAKTTDLSMVDKLNKQFVKTDLYRKSKHREPVFAVSHYAGLVTYNAIGFLGKNRDTLSTNMQSLMENSQNNLLNELFTAKVSEAGTLDMRHGSTRTSWTKLALKQPQKRQFAPGDSLSRQAGRKLRQKMYEMFQDIPLTDKPNSVTAHFKNSLQMLVDKLKGAEPHFIRCIKPNHQKLSGVFEPKIVTEQLKSTGVLETVKIRRLGYAVRLPFNVFLKRYKFIVFPLTLHVDPSPSACHQIIKCAKIQDVQIGNSKIFLKYWHCDQLNQLLDRLLFQILRVQALLRAYLVRQQFLRMCHISKRDADDLHQFSRFVSSYGDLKYQDMMAQCDHDDRRRLQVREEIQNGYHDEQNSSSRRTEQKRLPDVFSPNSERYTGAKGFYKFIIDQVKNKYHELDPDVWCKIFYMEYDRPVSKFYICDREVTIDGSQLDFSGKQIGLGVFNNSNRNEIVSQIRGFIGKGLRLCKESNGSITATRLGKNDVVVKGYQDPANHCLSADVIKCEGLLPKDQPVKIFDMDEFKSHIGIAMRTQTMEDDLDLLAISGLSFIEDNVNDLETPCWICIINLLALEALDNPDVKREMLQKFIDLRYRNSGGTEEKNQKMRELAERHNRNWSKLNLRPEGQGKKEPLRKQRLQIKQKGDKVQDIMDYSWEGGENESRNKPRNLTELQNFDRLDTTESVYGGRPGSGSVFPSRADSIASSALMVSDNSKSPRKDWAKIKNTIKQESTQEAEAQQKGKSPKVK